MRQNPLPDRVSGNTLKLFIPQMNPYKIYLHFEKAGFKFTPQSVIPVEIMEARADKDLDFKPGDAIEIRFRYNTHIVRGAYLITYNLKLFWIEGKFCASAPLSHISSVKHCRGTTG
jgi:hypothetical protein